MTVDVPLFPSDVFEEERETVLALVRDVAFGDAQRFILGARVAALEQRIAEATGATHVIACSSGTGALELCVHAMDIHPGDEVIVPAFCCQPVASAVIAAGATPIFADVDESTLVLDPAEVEARISARTKAIMPAHVFSVMADMPTLTALARRHGLTMIEDAAVAQGAVLHGRPAGRWGDAGVFSFFQVKALGTIGEGGVVLTDDDAVAVACRRLRNHGQDPARRGIHERIGLSSRMDEIVAGFLLHRIDGLDARLARRARIATYYTERFAPLQARGLRLPPAGNDGRCYYVYAVLTDDRDSLREHLAQRGIGTHVYYPLPLPAQPAFARYASGRRFPCATAAGRRNLALPVYPHLSDADVERVADAVEEFFESASGRP